MARHRSKAVPSARGVSGGHPVGRAPSPMNPFEPHATLRVACELHVVSSPELTEQRSPVRMLPEMKTEGKSDKWKSLKIGCGRFCKRSSLPHQESHRCSGARAPRRPSASRPEQLLRDDLHDVHAVRKPEWRHHRRHELGPRPLRSAGKGAWSSTTGSVRITQRSRTATW